MDDNPAPATPHGADDRMRLAAAVASAVDDAVEAAWPTIADWLRADAGAPDGAPAAAVVAADVDLGDALDRRVADIARDAANREVERAVEDPVHPGHAAATGLARAPEGAWEAFRADPDLYAHVREPAVRAWRRLADGTRL